MSFKLAVVQPVTHRPPDDERNVADAVRAVEDAAGQGAALVAFPESYPGPWRMPAAFDPAQAMADVAQRTGAFVQYGTLEPIDDEQCTAHQLSVLATPGGETLVYRRTHPPGPWLYTGGDDWEFQYVAADEFPVFETELGTIGLAVCSEVYMPEVSRALALRGAEIILIPSGTEKPELWATWRTLIWARAIENLAIVVTTQNLWERTQLGQAMVASPEEIIFESTASGTFLLDIDLEPVRRLRGEQDGVTSSNRAKAGVLTQWQRPELHSEVLVTPTTTRS